MKKLRRRIILRSFFVLFKNNLGVNFSLQILLDIIRYYYDCKYRVIEDIDIDNVKRIYIEYYSCKNKKVYTLYFDDIKIHSIDKESVEEK